MDPLVLAAASAVVTAMATDGWQQAREAVVKLWRRSRPGHVPAIETDLDETRAEVIAARTAGDRTAEEGLVADWERKLRRLLDADPALADHPALAAAVGALLDQQQAEFLEKA